jgi:hypothetical protein
MTTTPAQLQFIQNNYEIIDHNHASAILAQNFPVEYDELNQLLFNFRLKKTDILQAGGRKSPIATALDANLYALGWQEKLFNTNIVVDGVSRSVPTHKVDCFKNRVGIEIEWNNKDPFFDRDLNNFRLLFELNAISVGVIITRATELQQIFDTLGKGSSYGASTTHFNKLRPKIAGNGGGGCPVLAFGIKSSLVVP